jgi:hypothetical protein
MSWIFVLVPFVLQTLVILLDEGIFHIKRGLPRWERIGHPLDTLSVIACTAYVLFVPFSPSALKWFVVLAIISCLFVTKDEFVHKEHCPASEQWLHALLFLNHPIMLGCLGLIWPVISKKEVPVWLNSWQSASSQLYVFLFMQGCLMVAFCLYQIIYWNFIYEEDQQRVL